MLIYSYHTSRIYFFYQKRALYFLAGNYNYFINVGNSEELKKDTAKSTKDICKLDS